MSTIYCKDYASATPTRQPRPTSIKSALHILPYLSEEDEYSSSSSETRTSGGPRRRKPRPMPLTGLPELSLEDAFFFACSEVPAPAPKPAPTETHITPPTPDSSSSDSSFHLTFTSHGLSFEFPPPPPAVSSPPSQSRPRAHAHKGSTSSISSVSTNGGLPRTPVTSDDERPTAAPIPFRFRPRSSTKPLVIKKPRASSSEDDVPPVPALPAAPIPQVQIRLADADEDADAESDSEWYAREFSDVLSLRSPLPANFPTDRTVSASRAHRESAILPPARPESFLALPRPKSQARLSVGAAPSPTMPSAQLDPAFPPARSVANVRRRSSIRLPARPPPPPPPSFLLPPPPMPVRSPKSPLSPALPRTPNTPQSLDSDVSRPLPCSTVPDDVFDCIDELDGASLDLSFGLSLDCLIVRTPLSAATFGSSEDGADIGSNVSVVGFTLESPPMTPIEFGMEGLCDSDDCADGDLPAEAVAAAVPCEEWPAGAVPTIAYDEAHERKLRSRWSSSTLASVAPEREQRVSRLMPISASSRLKFYFGGAKKEKEKQPQSQATPMTPPKLGRTPARRPSTGARITSRLMRASLSPAAAFTPPPPTPAPTRAARSSVDSDTSFESPRGLDRRDRRASRESLDSAESGRSLPARKPIPIEIFMRA